jgi:glycosyltransferase involved in cell wall biosynthesis
LKIKKTVFTLNIGNYAPEITDLTYPLIKEWCRRIGADFYEITENKFPEWKSPTYNKLQIYELAQKMENDWNIFIDCDAVIHPDFPDITDLLQKDTIFHNGSDFSLLRWKYDRFFKRDGRHIGSPTWFCIASDWCIDLFKPLDDLTPEEAYSNIFPTLNELKSGYEPWRLIEDYVMSRNIAKYGLKFKSFTDLKNEHPGIQGEYLWHIYAVPNEEKLVKMKELLKNWKLL